MGHMASTRVSTQGSDDISIAVVIPLYNGERYIREAIESALRQSLPPTEIIVVDDGSTDNGPAVVDGLARRHPITLLRRPNGGQSAARNFGIAQAGSNLIALLDQDDIWYRDHLEKLAEPFLQRRTVELGWVYSNLDEIDEHGRLVCRSILRFLPAQHPKRDLLGSLRSDMFILPSASLVSRKAFEAVGGFDERLIGYEDDDLFLRMFRAGYDNVYLDEALSQWRLFGGSSSYSPRMAVSRMAYLRKLLAEFPDDPARGRFWRRDVIAPRFLPHLIKEYIDAVRSRDRELLHVSLDNLQFISDYHSGAVRVVLRMLLPLLFRFPGIARLLLVAKPALQPLTRPIMGGLAVSRNKQLVSTTSAK
jgi:glycosyltransferase involved in cell wall biosynthesis